MEGMIMKTISPSKFNALFFIVYACLMGSLIFFAVTYNQSNSKKIEVGTNEITLTFSKELQKYEEEKKQKEMIQTNKWKPSRTFVITAIGISSVLDVLIILLWARHENKKREAANHTPLSSKKWVNSPKFWTLLSMGMLQIKHDRISIHWRNTILVVIMMLILKLAITKTII